MIPFATKIEQECVVGSAIAPELLATAINVVPDLVVRSAGDVETPIHDALNWTYSRFGKVARTTQHAALFLNEDGSVWQAKLEYPVLDSEKGKFRKYETPKDNGSRAFLPDVPGVIRDRISARYQVDIPLTGSFWSWLKSHPDIPLIWTEGGKKALSLLSQGYVAIALYGICGGYRGRKLDETHTLIPDVVQFCQPGRSHVLAFDQEQKLKTQRRVAVAQLRFGYLLKKMQGSVSVVSWNSQHGKGVDDFIAACGTSAFEQVYADALPLQHWKLTQALKRPLSVPIRIRLNTPDLSTVQLDGIPDSGVVAIQSAKGTGKTKLLDGVVEDTEKVLCVTHRIALGRNLSTRLHLSWRADLDKMKGAFITESGFTRRIGLCADSLLAIDPEQFKGCDLILDEACQVMAHLLQSSTCATDGKRPALLARFRELIQGAKRVIVADADLNDAVLSYLCELRNDGMLPFLIHNDYQPIGYPVTFIDAPDRTEITQRLLKSVKTLPSGRVIFVATDSKTTSHAIAQILSQSDPEKRLLLINSDTSGRQREQAFVSSPDPVLRAGEVDVVITSPSMATGVSIEAQGIIHQVFGIFTGVSATDADLAQALARVREPVERIIWCAKTGRNTSGVSRSNNPIEVKAHLYESTAATVRLVRSNLREDAIALAEGYQWHDDPHLNLYCRLLASQNASMKSLRDALYVRLRTEGSIVRIEQAGSHEGTKLLLRSTRQVLQQHRACAIAAARDLSWVEVKALQELETQPSGSTSSSVQGLSPDDSNALEKFRLKEFYNVETVTEDLVEWDDGGRRRAEILSLEVQLNPDLAMDRTVKSFERQAAWNQRLCPWDISTTKLRQALREVLGLNQFIALITRQGTEWTKYDLAALAQKARNHAKDLETGLNFTIHPKMADTQIAHELLLQLGIRIRQSRWSRSMLGHEGKKLRVYTLDESHWEKVQQVLTYRQQWRERLAETGSPVLEEGVKPMGDPNSEGNVEMFQEAVSYGVEILIELWQRIPQVQRQETLRRMGHAVLSELRSALITSMICSAEVYPRLHRQPR
ncbi:MAG: DUF3854 domain-containing protein [Myxacorys californica WJT36-NPBG1]|jgi:hypothetical protein|nr:DUF3854 domain-containing protein [Myxacorys californica WJT36-NPBG1]